MRVLAVHNRYLIKGGEDGSHRAEVELLRAYSHEVDEYVEDNQNISRLGKASTALRTVWSQETYRKTNKILKNNGYDLLIVQNFFPLISPSIYYAARANEVPVVQFLRNYRLLCLNAHFYRSAHVCVECQNKFIPWPGMIHACYRNSLVGSSVVATMLVTHRLLKTWTRLVDKYIVLSEFAKQIFIQGGIPEKKIAVRPNFLFPDPGKSDENGGYAVFAGRLSEEKGILTLLSTWNRLDKEYPLKIIGDGLLSSKVIDFIKDKPWIEYCGTLSNAQTIEQLKQASCLVFPSLCYEGMPRTIIEAFAVGTPVISSNIGAMASMIRPGVNGYLFNPGDADDLLEKMITFFKQPKNTSGMRDGARNEFESLYTSERAYQRFMDIVNSIDGA